MNQNLPAKGTKRKNKPPYFAITSLVIGILMVLVIPAMLGIEYAHAWAMTGGVYFPAWLYLSVTFVNCIGFISGIIGLQSNKKGLAIAGIAICALVLIPCIFGIYIALVYI